MKSVIADPATRVICLRIVARSGTTVRLTQYPIDLVMSNGDVYMSASGYTFSGLSSSTSMSPSLIDLEGIVGLAGIGRDELSSGVFDGARCFLFATSWAAPVVDEEPMVKSIFGKTTIKDDLYVIEEMSLLDALGQSVGLTVTPTCWKRFGSAECGKDIGPLTVTGTLTHVTDAYTLRDSARTEADDYFGAGTIAFTSGQNVGLRPIDISAYSADGTITLQEPPYYPVAVGTSYSIVPGCRKREIEDCQAKWANRINCGAFSNVPTKSVYTTTGGIG